MKHASLASSPLLIRTLHALQRAGGEVSTMELARAANIIAVSAVIAELRANGARIACRQVLTEKGQRRWMYRLIKSPEGY